MFVDGQLQPQHVMSVGRQQSVRSDKTWLSPDRSDRSRTETSYQYYSQYHLWHAILQRPLQCRSHKPPSTQRTTGTQLFWIYTTQSSSCLHYLLPPQRDPELLSRLNILIPATGQKSISRLFHLVLIIITPARLLVFLKLCFLCVTILCHVFLYCMLCYLAFWL